MSSRIVAVIVAPLCAAGIPGTAVAQGPPVRTPSSQQSSRTQSATQAVSPTVMATWVAGSRNDGARVLQNDSRQQKFADIVCANVPDK